MPVIATSRKATTAMIFERTELGEHENLVLDAGQPARADTNQNGRTAASDLPPPEVALTWNHVELLSSKNCAGLKTHAGITASA
jgi:hypothetical protein